MTAATPDRKSYGQLMREAQVRDADDGHVGHTDAVLCLMLQHVGEAQRRRRVESEAAMIRATPVLIHRDAHLQLMRDRHMRDAESAIRTLQARLRRR